jgi:hypothetical protein
MILLASMDLINALRCPLDERQFWPFGYDHLSMDVAVPYATITNVGVFPTDAGVSWDVGCAFVADTLETIDKQITTAHRQYSTY